MAGEGQELYRTLGRIEGKLDQLLGEQKNLREDQKQLREDFGDHRNEDQKNFSALRALVYEKAKEQKSEIDSLATAKAILTGQFTLGQKFLVSLGAIATFAWAVFETFFNHPR